MQVGVTLRAPGAPPADRVLDVLDTLLASHGRAGVTDVAVKRMRPPAERPAAGKNRCVVTSAVEGGPAGVAAPLRSCFRDGRDGER
jgi:hypothetical protein